MSDELDDYEDGVERAEADEEDLALERLLADADELIDAEGEDDLTPFDEARLLYSGVDDDGGPDTEELDEAGARLDDPERLSRLMDT
jgi:hypothetical protein